MTKKVAVLMGSANDAEKMQPAREMLERFGIEHEVWAMSAHRNPSTVVEFVSGARENGYGAIIAAAGMAAHLAGVCAANTTLPVIGVPMAGGALNGVDALYSTVQMPPGMPVATVAINGAANAALLAISILSVEDAGLAKLLDEYRATWKPQRL
ncbi:MAG: 5-(carboxyamino)imidazole ribonucleotide mutase [Actinomycetota bacterium]|jgi:5-(carboxyamino)imidazole ribonucleotide mutase|nr:5-(carboxyamino)imidazole ribonucleotide mutase [Actinomycetota bacterium]